eukprot:TRINITY_DN18256_c0_g2_i1.p1 TRINITY_DN18256_c0_g2~~TRINITY_DN18256_c0_g2_i1.p1  ORF type:complete len:1031 (+),score=394.86 TRINITY_DN18256_c0_g2_i1:122-3214(+)
MADKTDVEFTVSRLRNVEAPAAGDGTLFQLVWQGLQYQGQTAPVAADKSGVVPFAQTWTLKDVPRDAADASSAEISMALWRYPPGETEGEPQNIGLSAVRLVSFAEEPLQRRELSLAVTGQRGAVVLELRLAAQGAVPRPRPAAAALAPDSGAAPAARPAPSATQAAQGEPDSSGAGPAAGSEAPQQNGVSPVAARRSPPPRKERPAAATNGMGAGGAQATVTLQRRTDSERWGVQLSDHLVLSRIDSGTAASACAPLRNFLGCPLTHVNGTAVQHQHEVVQLLDKKTVAALRFDPEPLQQDGQQGQGAARLVSPLEIRQWVADVLSMAASQEDGEVQIAVQAGKEGITDPKLAAISEQGIQLERLLELILDAPLLQNADASTPNTSERALSERLTSAALDVYLHSSEIGHRVAKLLRDETSTRLINLLRLPQAMTRRAFVDNIQATLHVAHLIQYHAMMKVDSEVQKTRSARKAQVRNAVVYVTEETFLEWAETQVDQHIAFELPVVTLRRVDTVAEPSAAGGGGMCLTQLRRMIDEDQAAGAVPAAVVGRIGAEGYNACDDFDALVKLCASKRLWLHVDGPAMYFLGSQWSQYEPLRKAVSENATNVSLIVCEDEVPGLGKLPGFWTLCSGKDCGGRQLPQDTSAEADLSSIRAFLPSYLRLRSSGTDSVQRACSARYHDSDRVRAIIKDINQRSGVAGASIIARLHTHPANQWNVRFRLLPSDHPLVTARSVEEVRQEVESHPVSVDRINAINRCVHRLLRKACGGHCGFTVRSVDGLLWWEFSLLNASISDGELPKLRELVLGVGDDMVSLSPYAARLPDALGGIPGLQVVQRAVEVAPLELCALRLVPKFYETQEQLSEADMEDINSINGSLHAALEARSSACGAVFGTAAHQEGVTVVTCTLRSVAEQTPGFLDKVRQVVQEGVHSVLNTDQTVLRIEDEMTQRGIAVAEKQLQESAARQEDLRQQGMLRTIPVVAEVMNWLMPVPDADEGLKFDLTTSTLKKEERCLPDAAPLIAPSDAARRE